MSERQSLLGVAGEHYVMYRLLRRGLIGALAPVGVPHVDILVTNTSGARLCALQVKSRRDKGTDGGWHMHVKHESLVSDSLLYAFVDFGRDQDADPSCFIVPSDVVASAVRDAHVKWLMTPGKGGKSRKDSKLRRFLPDYERKGLSIGRGSGWLEVYRDAWNRIEAR